MLVDGEGLASEMMIYTYHEMCQLRHWALQVESRGDVIKTGGNGNSKQNGSVDSTTNSVSINSMQVNGSTASCRKSAYASNLKNAGWRLTSVVWATTNCTEHLYGVI